MKFLSHSTVLLVGALLAGGCDEVEIVADCELVTDPVLVEPGEAVALRGLAILGDRLLISYVRLPRGDEGDRVNVHEARWFDLDGNPLSEPEDLGTLFRHRTHWVPVGDVLMGQVWGDPMARSPDEVSERAWVYRWRLRPEQPPEHLLVQLQLAPGRTDALLLGSSGLPVGTGVLPAASTGTTFFMAFTAPPLECGERLTSYLRLHVADAEEPVARPLRVTANLCDIGLDAGMSNPWLYYSPTMGRYAALYRLGRPRSPGSSEAGGRMYHSVVGEAELLESRRVGGSIADGEAWPFQPRAVEHDGTVYFTDLDGETDVCHRLRTMSPSGGDAGLGRWQLPCWEPGAEVMSRSAELAVADAGVVLVYSQRDGPYARLVEPGDDYDEGIYLTLLTGDGGKRGSEVLEITTDASSSFPRTDPPTTSVPQDFLPMVSAAEEDVVVAWEDRRADAPGIYVRRVRCVPR